MQSPNPVTRVSQLPRAAFGPAAASRGRLSALPTSNAPRSARGVTLVEIMVVVAIIAALVGILLPALSIVRGQARLVTSQSNLRSIAALMTAYSVDNRDYICPSQFDYNGPFVRTTVRSASPDATTPNIGPLYRGSWTDILWTVNKLGPITLNDMAGNTDLAVPNPLWDYRFDSPDFFAYASADAIENNPFRSKAELKKPFNTTDDASLPTPFGNGAGLRETGQPGYYAANDFFDCRGGNWYTNAVIRRPIQSVYVVDSRAGETIPVTLPAWKPDTPTGEVEFRYIGDVCTMLFLDGHVTNESKWVDLNDLQVNRQIRVEKLDQR